MNLSDLNSSDWPNFIYISLLLILLISKVLFKSHLKALVLLKQALIWSIIMLVIIIAYSFRFELFNLKNRILAELHPSKVVKINDDQIVISVANDEHFYINLLINGNIVRFMVDTGASDMVLSKNDAKRIGIDINKLYFNKKYQTANGIIFGAGVVLREVAIDDLKFYNISASINDSTMNTSLLGLSFLRKFKRYEFYQDKLILTY